LEANPAPGTCFNRTNGDEELVEALNRPASSGDRHKSVEIIFIKDSLSSDSKNFSITFFRYLKIP
jgi:hypothetical protein